MKLSAANLSIVLTAAVALWPIAAPAAAVQRETVHSAVELDCDQDGQADAYCILTRETLTTEPEIILCRVEVPPGYARLDDECRGLVDERIYTDCAGLEVDPLWIALHTRALMSVSCPP